MGFGGKFPSFPWITASLCLAVFAAHNFTPLRDANLSLTLPLITNLSMLFLVGSLVEFRRSPLLLLGVYLIGTGIGYWLHTPLALREIQLPLLSSSTGLAAVGGLFTAYFYKLRMRFLVFALPPFYKTFHVSSIVVLPVILLLDAFLNRLYFDALPLSLLAGYVIASIVGIGIGTLSERANPISWPFLYGFENARIETLNAEHCPHERIHGAQNLLQINPENMLAAEILCRSLLQLSGKGLPLTPESRSLLREYVPALMSVYSRQRQPERAFGLLPLIPRQFEFGELLDRSSQPVIAMGIQWALMANESLTLKRLRNLESQNSDEQDAA